jgi:glycosyltransferase involved in cell wall biosynthesis
MVTLCALIAAFNEEAHVADVVKGTAPHASPVVVVDDGSTDKTAARARDAGAIVISHEQNRGKGCAIRTGLEYALKQNCSHVLLLDADLQHDPVEIPRLVARAEQGNRDFVIGEREFRKDAMPAARFYANVIGSAILSRFMEVVAFLVRTDAALTPLAIRQRCAETLSTHKIPRRFVFVDRFPVDARGKIDQSALQRLVSTADQE